MHSEVADAAGSTQRSFLARAALFFAFWLALSDFGAADLLVGGLTAAIAAHASLRLLPPGQWRLRPFAFGKFALRFLRQSIVAGIDVAWRAFSPRMPLRPGFIVYQPRIAPGPMRDAFCTLTSLQPGTLPVGSAPNDAIVVHCLDIDQPVAAQLREDEALMRQALGDGRDNG
jgi:multicomponent Na+:H+ antiporter subunit E